MSAFQGALASYFLFGLGYIAYMTFVIAWMVSRGASAVSVALTWGTLGVATMLAPIVWRVPRSRWSVAKMLAAVGIVISIGAAIPLYSTALPAMILSAFFFGTAMFSVPTSITDLIKTSLPKTAWGPAMAVFTVVFAIGQSIGPVLTGWIADAAHSLKRAWRCPSSSCWGQASQRCASGKTRSRRCLRSAQRLPLDDANRRRIPSVPQVVELRAIRDDDEDILVGAKPSSA